MNEPLQPAMIPSGVEPAWILSQLDRAALLLDDGGAVIHANPAAYQLRVRLPAQGEKAFAALVSSLPTTAWDAARQGQRWSGRVRIDAAGVTLAATLTRQPKPSDGIYLATFHENGNGDDARPRTVDQPLALSREQLQQSEKMASIGQLAAGVAHEINNPIGYVHSNLGTLQGYVEGLLNMLDAHERALASGDMIAARTSILALRERLDIDFIINDVPKLLAESREGIERVCKIVQDLKEFSHAGHNEPMRLADLHRGLESTINIVWNDLKYKVRLEKHYGDLPLVECRISEINQVLLNLLLNAGQAIEESGTITVATGTEGEEAWISIADTGCGIPQDALTRIFDPFYTTKPIGRGTGIGLAVAYGIIARHHGRIEVRSRVGAGSMFRVVLPLRQPEAAPAEA